MYEFSVSLCSLSPLSLTVPTTTRTSAYDETTKEKGANKSHRKASGETNLPLTKKHTTNNKTQTPNS